MTTAARVVLEDCRGALADFASDLQGGRWRRHWILCVTLLRAVGHILDKVDTKTDQDLKRIINNEWTLLKKEKRPHIFHDFIDEERNTVLKQYEMRAGQGVIIYVKAVSPEPDPTPPYIETTHTITDGPYKGKNQRELIQEAIDFWQQYLGRIDLLYQSKKPRSPDR